MAKFLSYVFATFILIVPAWAMAMLGMYFSQDFFYNPHEAFVVGAATSFLIGSYLFVINKLKNKFFEN